MQHIYFSKSSMNAIIVMLMKIVIVINSGRMCPIHGIYCMMSMAHGFTISIFFLRG